MKRALVALATASVLAACGGSSESDPDESSSVGAGPAIFEFEYEGAKGTLDLTESAEVLSDEKIVAADEAVAQSSTPPLHYVLATVDNTDGSEDLNMYSLEIVTDSGDTLTSLDFQHDVLGSDDGSYSDPTDAMDIIEPALSPGARDTAVFAFAEPIDSASRVYIYPSGGMDKVEAIRKD